jgi:hypothetical protein
VYSEACLTAAPVLQPPPFAHLSARMARVYPHLGLAAPAADVPAMLAGMTTLVLVSCINLAALGFSGLHGHQQAGLPLADEEGSCYHAGVRRHHPGMCVHVAI